MDINKNIGDIDTFGLGIKISFGSLDFIVDRLGDLQLCDPEPVAHEKTWHHFWKGPIQLASPILSIGGP